MPRRNDKTLSIAELLWDLAASKVKDARFSMGAEVPLELVQDLYDSLREGIQFEAEKEARDWLLSDDDILANANDHFVFNQQGPKLIEAYADAATLMQLQEAAGLPAPDRPVFQAAEAIFEALQRTADYEDSLIGPMEMGYEDWEEGDDGVYYHPVDGSELYIPQFNFYYSRSDVKNFIDATAGGEKEVDHIRNLLGSIVSVLVEDFEFWLEGEEYEG
jgi:hypothetical protein